MSQSDFVTRGQALVAAGQYQEAVKVCRLGLLGRPTTVEGRVVLGSALLALKRFDEVLAEMRVALELDHNSVAAQVLKAEALLKKGDPDGAIEVLKKLRQQAPTDQRIADLLAEAQRGAGKASTSAVHPSVGFVSPNSGEPPTKHYPNHNEEFPDDEASDGGYTRPTSLSSPASVRGRSAQHPAEPTPPPNVLAVGDRSGTMEVDPEVDGVDLGDGDDDFGDVAAPPRSGAGPQRIEGGRGSVQRAKPAAQKPIAARAPKAGSKKPNPEISTVELDDDEMIEVDTGESQAVPRRAPQGPRSMVRSAVQMPAGPLGEDPRTAAASPAAKRPTQQAPVVPPPQLAHMIAAQPHVMQYQAPQPPISAALPTAAAYPMPAQPAVLNASARTLALSPAQLQSANAVDALFGEPNPAPSWAQSTVVAGGAPHLAQQQQQPSPAASEPTARPSGLDPQIQASLQSGESPLLALGTEPASNSQARPLKTGVRKARSRLQIAMWVTIGILVIGGGVFAGFQIRGIRLRKEIEAERQKAIDAAKADTFAGWTQARNSLAGIVRASNTTDNRAALARARAVLGYQFVEGVPEAKATLDSLGATGTLDGAIAAAYVALAQGDAKAARSAADAAIKLAPGDAAALYATGQAQLLAGDLKNALLSLKSAVDAEPRALYLIGLAHAHGLVAQYDEAFAAIDKVLAATPDHPAALIERAFLLADSGRLTANATLAAEVKTKLEKLVAEAQKPIAEQPRGVSGGQAAYANLALALADFVLGKDAPADVTHALAFNIQDQRFAETTAETFQEIGDERALRAANYILTNWPSSVRGRLALAELLLASGKPTDALDTLGKSADVMSLPRAQAVRGMARLANGELDLASQDFEATLKKTPNLELALIGRAQILLAHGDVDAARKLIEPRYNVNTASLALATTYAQILRSTGDPTAREKARAMMERLVANLGGGTEVARAQLELARIYRDAGDTAKERQAYADAEKNGNKEAPIEAGVSLIDDASDPSGGRDTLNLLYARTGDHPNPRLVLETARARMLMGDHAGATQLLDAADKLPNVLRWQLDRERARLLLRHGDVSGAADAIGRTLDECGTDLESFIIAADVASADAAAATPKRPQLAAKVKGLAAERLKTAPDLAVIEGKLALAANDLAAAEAAYNKALVDLDAAKASPRRRAQANFGLAAVYYLHHDDPNARDKLDLVLLLDPTIYAAYAFYADILKEKDPKKAIDKARKATDLDPEFLEGWAELGELAVKVGDKKLLGEVVTALNGFAPDSEALRELAPLVRK